MEFRIPKHSWNLFVQDLGISNDHGEIWHIVKMQNDVKWDIQQQIMVWAHSIAFVGFDGDVLYGLIHVP